jgi:imidazolonepropionase-like amidohydrolase
MFSPRLVFAMGVVLLAGCGSPRPAAQSGGVLFEGARLIPGAPESAVENSALLVKDGKFVQVGKKGEIAADGAMRVDLSGKTVMPALVDTHTHLGWQIVAEGRIGADTYSRDNLIDHLNRLAYYGVAATRNLGIDPGETAYDLRANPVAGAALLRTAGRGMAMPNAGPGQDYWKPVAYGVTNEADARKAVQELAAKRVDIVKIWVDDRGGKVKKLTPALYRVIIDEAHKNGLPVIAHIFYLADAKDLLKAGIDAFGHGVRDKDIDDEFVTMMKAHPNVYVIPNLPDNPGAPPDPAWLRETMPDALVAKMSEEAAKQTPEAKKRALEFFALQARNLARLNTAGVKIAFGTDSGETVGWPVHTELADMVTAGMTPRQVLTAATRTSAEVLKLDQLGEIAAGKSADFIVLDGNPLDDILNTRRIARVYLRGAEVDRGGLHAKFTGGSAR